MKIQRDSPTNFGKCFLRGPEDANKTGLPTHRFDHTKKGNREIHSSLLIHYMDLQPVAFILQ